MRTSAYITPLSRYDYYGQCRSHRCYEMAGLRDALQRDDVMST